MFNYIPCGCDRDESLLRKPEDTDIVLTATGVSFNPESGGIPAKICSECKCFKGLNVFPGDDPVSRDILDLIREDTYSWKSKDWVTMLNSIKPAYTPSKDEVHELVKLLASDKVKEAFIR
jgi:hypothetical protein